MLGSSARMFSPAQQTIEKDRILHRKRLAGDALEDTPVRRHARWNGYRLYLDDERHLAVIKLESLADLEARNRLQSSKDLANP